MKTIIAKILSTFVLVCALGGSSSGFAAISTKMHAEPDMFAAAIVSNSNTAGERTNSPEKEFKKEAKKHNIATRTVNGSNKIYNGYYIIAGVYGDKNNVARFVKKLKAQRLNPKVITHPENKLNYVYLGHYTRGESVIASCISQLEGKYTGKVWIMEVTGGKGYPIEPKKAKTPKVKKETSSPNASISFKEMAKRHQIPNRQFNNTGGFATGYYVIAGVYGDQNNAHRFKAKLKGKGLNPQAITHPESNLNYVYVRKYTDWNKAIEACLSKINGSYPGKLWILEAKNDQSISKETPITSKGLKKQSLALSAEAKASPNDKARRYANYKKHAGKPINDKLREKADDYFDKMWYAEAAELYELILSENEENQSFDVIQRAGDAHYFNTNMERAYHWYDILYSKHKNEMSADNLFKYAHSLKGTGKYSRAKRLMRLYNRKLEKEELANLNDESATPNEVVLDNILATADSFDIKNLAINSKYSDFSPMFHKEDEVVFASAMDSAFLNTRRYKWNNQPYLDLYVAKINEESQEVRNAMKFSKKINTKYHEASVTFSADNNTMYFTRNNFGKKLKRDSNGVNHLKIYMSKKVDDEWTEAVELPFNSDNYSTGHPALSPDGKQLYFVSDMPGSIGGTDIFVVDVLGEGSYSEPRNLGPEINTERREMFPFINDKKLYFSSDGHVGLGGLDIYEVAFDENEGFLEVRNVGKPVNSKKDDFSYIVNEETQKGFFASNRRGGKGDDDIYSFKRLIPEEANENAISGVVTELVTGEIMPEALVILLDENNMKLKEMVTGEDGSFIFEDLDSNTKYTVKTVKGEYFDVEEVVTTKDNETVYQDIAMKRLEELIAIEDGIKKLKIEMIYFDFDKSYIRNDAAQELDRLVAVMREYDQMVIRIESHTDSRGARAYNKYLSDRRAKSTREYLIQQGIEPRRIESAIGYGEERLLNECDGSVRCSSEKHQLNRRSEFIIVNM
jgi:outer membrane protein OmpA-like peptidoglycan-associated protein/DNA-binding protein Fis